MTDDVGGSLDTATDIHLERVRNVCLALPKTSERLSHGEPTFFVHKKVFVMFADNHHDDGHIAVWLPVPPGLQTELIAGEPQTYFRPPYVGVRGWVGIELAQHQRRRPALPHRSRLGVDRAETVTGKAGEPGVCVKRET